MNSEYKFIRRGDPTLHTVVEVLGNEITQMSVEDLYEYLINVNPYFNAVYGNMTETYYSLEESIEILNFFLDQQMGNGKDDFLEKLLQIVDKVIPKINCLEVIGEPCSGKKNRFFIAFLYPFWSSR